MTFSRMNKVNEARGYAYRDGEGEPVKGKRGDKARLGDRMVQRLQGFIAWVGRRKEWKGWYRGWMVENPVGGLAGRPYMRHWKVRHKLVVVDLCAYGHYYMKPTHIWTSVMGWQPQGQRARGDGRCHGRCRMGYMGPKGRWRHYYAMGVESRKAKGGVGRKEMKQAMPHLLHREVLRAAMR